MSATQTYLAVYNAASAVGWLKILSDMLSSAASGKSPASAWRRVGPSLRVVQTMAVLEILHSMLKLVKSPVLSTALQVLSRLIVLWGYTNQSKSAQSHWSLYLLVISWATVEVPRYTFYAANLYGAAPYWLLWLRYSLFAVLYPTGISGELLQIWARLREMIAGGGASDRRSSCESGGSDVPRKALIALTIFVLLSYIPGSPFMYKHMITQRTKALTAGSA